MTTVVTSNPLALLLLRAARSLAMGLIALAIYVLTGSLLAAVAVALVVVLAATVVFPRQIAGMHPRLAWFALFTPQARNPEQPAVAPGADGARPK